MPQRGCGKLQQAGDSLAQVLRTNPFPFTPISMSYWKCVPYVTQQDYNYARQIFQLNQYKTRQLRTIIRYAKKFL